MGKQPLTDEARIAADCGYTVKIAFAGCATESEPVHTGVEFYMHTQLLPRGDILGELLGIFAAVEGLDEVILSKLGRIDRECRTENNNICRTAVLDAPQIFA